MKFTIEKSIHGFARNILEDGKVIIHLNEGTVRNEENIERIVYLLNVACGALYDPDTDQYHLDPPKTKKVEAT